jgi:lipopolysaccharide/colanic/teichoic acid biosynthesis glycosyltransferase
MRYSYVKRVLDFIISAIFLIVLSPLFLLISIAIKFDSQGDVVYKRRVIGENQKYFNFLKFRTMYRDSDITLEKWKNESPELYQQYIVNYKLDNDPRITKIGRFLRKSSLDELPQFINVFLGTMSLVGPRPIVEDEKEKYSQKHLNIRFNCKPGMTGIWQTSGRQELAYQDREELDSRYIENCSFALDMKILLKTPLVVLTKKGAL